MTAEQRTETKRAASAPLWRAMRAFLCLVFDLFGEPSDIAAAGALSRKTRALIAPWLRAGEAFLRRLLFIEALALADDVRVQPPTKRAPRPRLRKLYEFYADKPEDWRVSFRLLPPGRAMQRRSRSARRRVRLPPLKLVPQLVLPRPQPAMRVNTLRAVACHAPLETSPRAPRDPANAWPVAERLEALLRAYNDPHANALRLARLLHRNEPRALSALRPEPDQVMHLFGVPAFNRCTAICASRKRRRERHERDDSG